MEIAWGKILGDERSRADSQGGSAEEAARVDWGWWLHGVRGGGACSFSTPQHVGSHRALLHHGTSAGAPLQMFCSLNFNSIAQDVNQHGFTRSRAASRAESVFEFGGTTIHSSVTTQGPSRLRISNAPQRQARRITPLFQE